MTDVVFAPLVPWPAIWGLAWLAATGLAVAAWHRGRGTVLRAFVFVVLILALANPRIVDESRDTQPDIAVVVADDSESMAVGERRAQRDRALESLRARLEQFGDLEVRVLRAGETSTEDGATRLHATLARALAEVPRQRLAGAILLTDGQVHDLPEDPQAFAGGAPIHALIAGDRAERDRRLVVEQAPSYGLTGKPVTVAYRIEDRPTTEATRGRGAAARVTFRRDGQEIGVQMVPVGRSTQFAFELEHAGQTVIEIEAEPAGDELSLLNNRAVVTVQGVRERLRVLLISGQPHNGERMWRNLLKSDPSVDLVHFTILRPPEKDDLTPLRELALIVFPVQELFEVKLKEFNLIVFDRYAVREVLPIAYMRNIENYVREGGALLFAFGPEFAGNRSLYQTPLGRIMPAAPTGQVLEQPFRPLLTDLGRRHPVTAALPRGDAQGRVRWGRWFRQVDSTPGTGTVLMSGVEERPLLVLNRVEKGRVAQVLSDHIWLWARDFEGGGPQAELLRRLAHWLMREPDLEEENLLARAQGGNLHVERRSLSTQPSSITVTSPSGAESTLALRVGEDGRATATMPAAETGVYRVGDGARTALAAAGMLNSAEFADLRATAERLTPLVAASGGGLSWIGHEGVPEVRRVRAGRDSAGRGWIGLRRNEAYVVTGVVQVSLLPGLLVLALALAGLIGAWWRESR